MGSKIIGKKILSPDVAELVVSSHEIALKRQAGQFVIVRADEERSERIPLTIADADPKAGTITLVFQVVGKSTLQLSKLEVGDEIADLAGPLGRPTHIEKMGTVICVGGGIGIAPLYPIAKAMNEAGNKVVSIIGARTKELLIMEDQMRKVSNEIHVMTDDGSHGRKGFVTLALEEVLKNGRPDEVVAIGPAAMMKAVCNITRPNKVKTIVSLNTIMVDGTGMCGCCRASVGGETKFVCVDGPEFDGHLVDFDEMIKRQNMYVDKEKLAYERFKEKCCGKCR